MNALVAFRTGIAAQTVPQQQRKLKWRSRTNVVSAPRVLSFVQNPDEFSEFIGSVQRSFVRKQPLFLDMSAVEILHLDGLAVLLAAIVRFKAKRVPFNGNFPLDDKARTALERSGFFDHLEEKFNDQASYKLASGPSIFTHAKKRVESQLGEAVIADASKTIWGSSRRCPGVQRALVELMHNTNNHAHPREQGHKHWWLTVQKYPSKHMVAFTFVDFGEGIFGSLANKRQGTPLFGVLKKLYERTAHGDNAAVLRLVLQGELRKTVTGKYYRGKGLPGIHNALQRNEFSNLSIISNEVYFNSKNDECRSLERSFSGTLIYWEVGRTNHSLPAV